MSVGGEHPSFLTLTWGIPTPNLLLSRRHLCETLAQEVFSNSSVCSHYSIGKQAREMPNLGSRVLAFRQTQSDSKWTLLKLENGSDSFHHATPHLWQFVSEASWQDRPHTSSILIQDFLWALHARGDSHCRVMKEKNPALSTGCWCLGVKKNSLARISHLGAMCYVWERCDLEHERKTEKIFTRCGQIEDESHACVWTAVCTSLSELLGSSEKVQWLFISQHVQNWAVCEKRIRAFLSRPHWL